MADTKKCYFPSGDEISFAKENVVACDPTSTGHSACCPADAVCLSNGLCFQQDSWGNRIARSGCTDETWEDLACAGRCVDVFPKVPISIYLVEPDSVDGNFCCGGMYNQSGGACPYATKGSKEPFTMEKGMVLFPNTSLTLSQYALSVQAKDNSSTTGSLDDTMTTNTTGALETGSASIGGNARDSTTTSIALGASLGACLLILSGLLIWQWKRTRALQKELRDLKLAATTTNAAGFSDDKDSPSGGWNGHHQRHGPVGWTTTAGGWTPLTPSPGDGRLEMGDERVLTAKELPVVEGRRELQG